MENKIGEIKELLAKIGKAVSMSKTKQKTIDRNKEKLLEEVAPKKIEDLEQKIAKAEESKTEFDEMTVTSLEKVTSDLMKEEKRLEAEFTKKLLEISKQRTKIEEKAKILSERGKVEKEKIEKSKLNAIEKNNEDREQLQKEQEKIRKDISGYKKRIYNYADFLGITEQINDIQARTEEDLKVEEKAKKIKEENIEEINEKTNENKHEKDEEWDTPAVLYGEQLAKTQHPEKKQEEKEPQVKGEQSKPEMPKEEEIWNQYYEDQGNSDISMGHNYKPEVESQKIAIEFNAERGGFFTKDGKNAKLEKISIEDISIENREKIQKYIQDKYQLNNKEIQKIDMYSASILFVYDNNKKTDKLDKYVTTLINDENDSDCKSELKKAGIRINYNLKGIYQNKDIDLETKREIVKIANKNKELGIGNVKKGLRTIIAEKIDAIKQRIEKTKTPLLEEKTEKQEEIKEVEDPEVQAVLDELNDIKRNFYEKIEKMQEDIVKEEEKTFQYKEGIAQDDTIVNKDVVSEMTKRAIKAGVLQERYKVKSEDMMEKIEKDTEETRKNDVEKILKDENGDEAR